MEFDHADCSLNSPHTTTLYSEEEQIKSLSLALKEMMWKELLNAQKQPIKI